MVRYGFKTAHHAFHQILANSWTSFDKWLWSFWQSYTPSESEDHDWNNQMISERPRNGSVAHRKIDSRKLMRYGFSRLVAISASYV
jgi:hypothetical protein